MDYEVFQPRHQALRERARQFVSTEVSPHAAAWEEKGLSRELMTKLGAAGLLGLKFQTAAGGPVPDKIAAAVFVEELARAGVGGLAAAVFAHSESALPLIDELGSEQRKPALLGPGTLGKKIGTVALLEPTSVYKLSAIETVARRQGDRYVLEGAKTQVVNGAGADFIIVSAKTGEGEDALSLFVVESGAPGLAATPSGLAAWRSAKCADLVFTGLELPASSRLGPEGEAGPALARALEWERIVIALAAAASALEIWRATLKHTKEAKVGAVPMYKTQELSFSVAEVAATIAAAAELAHEALWKHARGQRCLTEALAARIYAAKCLAETVERATQVFGPAGLVQGHQLERFARDARMALWDGGGLGMDKELLAEQMGL